MPGPATRLIKALTGRNRELRKGLLVELAKGDDGTDDEDTWEQSGFKCRVRRSSTGLVYMTIEGGGMPLPYHMVVDDVSQARKACATALPLLASGMAPREGVFRKIGPLRQGPRVQRARA